MPLFDLALIIIICGFAFFGLFFGLIHTLGSLLGTILGLWTASQYTDDILKWISLQNTGSAGKVIAFILVFIISSRLVGLVFWLLEKLFGFLKFIPFAKSLNRLFGFIFGLTEGVIVMAVILYFVKLYIPSSLVINDWINQSQVAPYLFQVMDTIKFWLPFVGKFKVE
jgi:uncharacterized membrane protein required for colicin V production